ncbi:hypothetical protein HJFPF1_07037 [Paramyrothecium foliicola]|nr:hypothetical protein HJFPF1_07037 [Paramyrothecium foliicola]
MSVRLLVHYATSCNPSLTAFPDCLLEATDPIQPKSMASNDGVSPVEYVSIAIATRKGSFLQLVAVKPSASLPKAMQAILAVCPNECDIEEWLRELLSAAAGVPVGLADAGIPPSHSTQLRKTRGADYAPTLMH